MNKKLYNLHLVEEMSGGSREFIDKMIHLFLRLTPELLDRIKTALHNHDYDELRASSHKMIASIDIFEISSIKNVVRNIERMATDKADIKEVEEAVKFLDQTLNQVLVQLKNEL